MIHGYRTSWGRLLTQTSGAQSPHFPGQLPTTAMSLRRLGALGVYVCESARDTDVTIITVKLRTGGSRRFSRRNLFPGKLISNS